MVTTITVFGALAKKKDMNTIYGLVIEAFEAKLRAYNCNMINVSSSDSAKTFLGRNQVITIVWTGSTTQIKSSYNASVHYGLFGIPNRVDFY